MKNRLITKLLFFLVLFMLFRCTQYEDTVVKERDIKRVNLAEIASKDTDAIKKLFIFKENESFDSVSSLFFIKKSANDTIPNLVGVKVYCLFVDSSDYKSIFRIYENIEILKYPYKWVFAEDTLEKYFVIDPGTNRNTLNGKWSTKKDTLNYIIWDNVFSNFKGWCKNEENINKKKNINIKLKFFLGKDTAYSYRTIKLYGSR